MQERTWRTELTWWLSAFFSLLAVLLPLGVVTGTVRALADPARTDLLNEAVGLASLEPIHDVQVLGAFFLSGALSCRLLVPTFLGVNPRVVSAIFCTLPVAFGAWVVSLNPLLALVYGAAAFVWSQIVPLPLADVMEHGPLWGGLLMGLGLAALLPADSALLAILWCCWRLYRDHPLEVAITAAIVAILPLLLILDEPGAAFATGQSLYSSAETGLLICLAVGAAILARFTPPSGEAERR